MATSFSPSTLVRPAFQSQLNRPKFTLLLDSCQRERSCAKCHLTSDSWRSAANYVNFREGSGRFSIVPKNAKTFSVLRTSVFRCATVEEFEREKFLIEKNVKERMEKTIDTIRSNFNSISTGRSNPSMLDRIEVEYYATPVSLKSIAQISSPDSTSLLIQPYDKSCLKLIEMAIVRSDLGLNPNNDGEVIRLNIPQLTSDRRKELAKVVAKQVEEGKIALRNIRRDALKACEKLEKEKKLSGDKKEDLWIDLQKLTDEYIKKVDMIHKQKEKELLKV